MAKRRLLRGNWVIPNVAFFLFLASSTGLLAIKASAAEDSAPQPAGTSAPAAAVPSQPAAPASAPPNAASENDRAAAPASTPPTPAAPTEAAPAPTPTPIIAVTPDEKPKLAPAQKDIAQKETKAKEDGAKSDGMEPATIKASNVNAVYSIKWLGTYIGDFKLKSSINNRQYSMQAHADISVFFGTVNWQGVTSSRGLMTANGPVPQSYSFRYSTNDRREAIELRFAQRTVQDIIINPPSHASSRSIPLTAAHLQNVVDPLSAIVLLAQARLSRHGSDACNRRLPVFDGKTRYDLVLSPKGTRNIGNSGRLRGTAYVCSVRYVPIAGHKPGRGENDYAAGNTGIEVWLVPVPEAGLMVPYYVNVPTPAGTASMVTARFDIETPSGRHALAD